MATKLEESRNGARLDIISSFEELLALPDDRPIEEVFVPQWGKTVLMRPIDQAGRDAWELRLSGDVPFALTSEQAEARKGHVPQLTVRDVQTGMKALLVAQCWVGPDGNRLMTDKQAMHLQTRNPAAVDLLATKANEICGFTPQDLEKLAEKALKAKNASARPSGEPLSDSPTI